MLLLTLLLLSRLEELKVKAAQSCSTLCDPMDSSMEFSRPEYWSGQPFPSPWDLPNPRIEPRSPALWADSLPTEPQGKPKNTGMGSLFLLQQIFPIQELNQYLLHCRQILYQLSYQGSPEYIQNIQTDLERKSQRISQEKRAKDLNSHLSQKENISHL